MRLIKQSIEKKDGSGSATLLPEEPEDMWHAYNLIRPTDLLRASAIRRVTTESMTGSSTSKRVQTTLTLRVTSLDFDPQAAQLHVSGTVAEENEWVKRGSYHTLDLELQRNFTLEKADGWDSIALETLKDSIDQTQKAELWAVVMQEGLANICLIRRCPFRQQDRLSQGNSWSARSGYEQHLSHHKPPDHLAPSSRSCLAQKASW
jgi:protein pelota